MLICLTAAGVIGSVGEKPVGCVVFRMCDDYNVSKLLRLH